MELLIGFYLEKGESQQLSSPAIAEAKKRSKGIERELYYEWKSLNKEEFTPDFSIFNLETINLNSQTDDSQDTVHSTQKKCSQIIHNLYYFAMFVQSKAKEFKQVTNQ